MSTVKLAKKELSSRKRESLLSILRTRFEENMKRH